MADDTTPNLALPYIMAAQAQKHVTHNEAIRALDALVHLAVIDTALATAPATPVDGDRYIVPTLSTGAWAGHTGEVAAFQDGAWAFFAPRTGWTAWDASIDSLLVFDGASWTSVTADAALNPTPLVGINTTADTGNRLAVSSPATLFNHAGAGHQQKINKAAVADTATVLYQTGFSGRAETGLAGDDDFHFKVSADGTVWREALVLEHTTGTPRVPSFAAASLPSAAAAGAGAVVFVPDAAGGASLAVSDGATWKLIGAATVPQAAAPTFTPAAGAYGPAQSVTIASATPGATIRYTLDGSTPLSTSPVYASPLTVASSVTIKAISEAFGFTTSPVATAAYTINGAVAAPTFSPAAGTYAGSQSVAISCATPGATIHVTSDGSTPTTASAAYTAPVSVAASATLRAIAVKSAYTDSNVATAAYTITGWYDAHNLASGNPSVILDFVGNRYRVGGADSTLAALVANAPALDADGMPLTAANITAAGALLSALQGAACTIVAETSGGSNAGNGGLISFGNDAPLFKVADKVRTYRSSDGIYFDTANAGDWAGVLVSGVALDATGRAIALTGIADVASDGLSYPSPPAVQLGSFAGGSLFGGNLRRLVVWPRRLSDADLKAVTWPLPYLLPASGTNALEFRTGEKLSLGNVLGFERSQPWSCIAALRKRSKPASGGAALVFSTVSGTVGPFRGYEVWINDNGRLGSRIMSAAFNGGSDWLGRMGSINVCDGVPHIVAVTYDGSSTAAGVAIYVDGVLDTAAATENDALLSTIVQSTPFVIGNQTSFETQYFLDGVLDHFVIYDRALTGAEIAARSLATGLPGVEAGQLVRLAMDDGSGLAVADTSGNNRTGTLTSAAQWLR